MIVKLSEDQRLEYEQRIANMINEGGLGVKAYYDYEEAKQMMDLPHTENNKIIERDPSI